MDNTRRLELTVIALKESLAQKVVAYEEQIANIRADATMMMEENGLRIAELEAELERYKVNENEKTVSKEE